MQITSRIILRQIFKCPRQVRCLSVRVVCGCVSRQEIRNNYLSRPERLRPSQYQSYRLTTPLRPCSWQSSIHTSASHWSRVPDDPELKAILKEISADFKNDKDSNNATSSVTNSDTTQDERQTVTHLESIDTTEKSLNIDDELLRYDYEEFDFIEEEEEEEEEKEEAFPISLIRGRCGVYDIHELVQLLRSDNARDLCVIFVPSEMKFVDYMVIASGRSPRHLFAMALYVKRLYKLKRGKKDPPTCRVEGDPSSKWLALDLGNIILHLFTPDVREKYDLEMLWTVGAKYDPLCQEPKEMPDLLWVDDFATELTQHDKAFSNKPKTTSNMESLVDWHKT